MRRTALPLGSPAPARALLPEPHKKEEMEKLHRQLLALPERRALAETKRHGWWALGAVLFAVVGPILVLCLLPVGVLIAVGAFLAVCALAVACGFIGVLRGMVVVPALNDDVIEDKTRKRARETLKVTAYPQGRPRVSLGGRRCIVEKRSLA